MTSQVHVNRIAFNQLIDNFNEAEEEEEEEEMEEEVEEENVLEDLFPSSPLESAEEISFEGELFETINQLNLCIYLLNVLTIGQKEEKEKEE